MALMTKRARSSQQTIATVMRVARAAGAGMSPDEISVALNLPLDRAWTIIVRHRIPLAPRTRAQAAFPLVISKAAKARAVELALQFKLDPEWMMARLLEAVLDDFVLAMNLLDGVEPPAPAVKGSRPS